jgi:hypothetical protein
VADGHFTAIKLRLSHADFAQNIAAARAVKKRVGDGITIAEAIACGRVLDEECLYWIEEPIRHDDYAGYAKICTAVHTPMQTGENLRNTFSANSGRLDLMPTHKPGIVCSKNTVGLLGSSETRIEGFSGYARGVYAGVE